MAKVLVLRTCDNDMRSRGGFQWPDEGPVEAPDWDGGLAVCGGKLHGFLWGEGDIGLLEWRGSRWLVVEVETDDGFVDLGGKCGFRRGVVVHKGDRITAPRYIYEHGGEGREIICLDQAVGDKGRLTGGDSSRISGHDCSRVTGGDRSTVTGGSHSTVTGGAESMVMGGDWSTVMGGYGSTVVGGDWSTVTGGDRSTVVGGIWSAVTGGDRSAVMGGHGCVLAGGDRAVLTWCARDGAVMRVVSKGGQCRPGVQYKVEGGDVVAVVGSVVETG